MAFEKHVAFRIGEVEYKKFIEKTFELHYTPCFVLRCLVNKIAKGELDLETLLFPNRKISKK